MADRLTQRFRAARRDPGLVVLEGFHALKHALRFGAEIEIAVAADPAALEELAAELAPDLGGRFAALVEPVDAETLAALVPQAPRTGVVALARRPQVDLAAALADPRPAPVVALEQPRNMGNLGACVRVAAAADAAALVAIGENDPWSPDAVRGGAGLQFALPVARIERLGATGRPLVAIDPTGTPLTPGALPEAALCLFGSERTGIGADLLARASLRLALVMRPGVSSLNLATAVAATLYLGMTGRSP